MPIYFTATKGVGKCAGSHFFDHDRGLAGCGGDESEQNSDSNGLAARAVGIVSAIIGKLFATYSGLPAGPLVILISRAIFAVTVPMAKV